MTAFEKGNDLTVLVDGVCLGGVYELRRSVKKEDKEIKEFLTDKPAAVLPRERYYITVKLRRGAVFPFDGGIGQVSVTGRGRTEIYRQCKVQTVESTAAARGETDYTVVIQARERSVTDE